MDAPRPDSDALPGATPRPRVQLRLLGGLEAVGPQGPLRFESVKSAALLAYLALSPGRHRRPKLYGMFWPEVPETRAARNLRHALWSLRQGLQGCGVGGLQADRTAVALAGGEVAVDAALLLHAAQAGGEAVPGPEVQAILEAGGDLLEGVFLPAAPAFEEWLELARQRLQEARTLLLQRLVSHHRGRGEWEAALAWARRLVAADPWREESHRTLMEVYSQAGRPDAALAQFLACQRILAEQLHTTPSAATTRLAERIRAGATGERPDAALVRHNLPAQTTPFFGRDEELAEVERRLADPACRAVCLHGPGGVGKTRLALQLGFRYAAAGAGRPPFQEVWFVPPREGGDAGGLRGAITEAVGLPAPAPTPGEGAADPLFAYFRPRRALLVLDVMEHLLHDAGVLGELLARAPHLKLLVTSRETLPLPGTWTVAVAGLPIPPPGGPGVAESPAFRLFVAAARRARPDFALDGGTVREVAQLCRAVEGLPLALELAAGWLASARLADVLRELRRQPQVLDGRGGELARVFTSSWVRLSSSEQAAMEGLAVFAGGFSLAAAEEVAGAALPTLRRLADTSFVRRDLHGRYSMHEVLRRFALQRLERDAGREQAVRGALAEHLARRLRTLTPLRGEFEQRALLDEVGGELENLQTAWRWAVAHRRGDLLKDLLAALRAYAEHRGWLRGALGLVEEALAASWDANPDTVARLTLARASLHNLTGCYEQAQADAQRVWHAPAATAPQRAEAMALLGISWYYRGHYDQARPHLEAASADPAAGAVGPWCDLFLGRSAKEHGRHREAETLFARALARARALGLSRLERWATLELGMAAYFSGQLQRAEDLCQAALRQAETAGDETLAREASVGLGYVLEDRAAFAEARRRYEYALRAAREAGDRRGEAYALVLIGETFRRAGQGQEARERYREALAMAHELDSRYLVSITLSNFAYVAAAGGELAEAASTIREILQSWQEHRLTTVATMAALIAAAEVLHRQGEPRRALRLLGLVRAHPAYRQDHACEAERVLEGIRRDAGPAECERHLRQGSRLRLEEEVAALLARSPFALPSPAGWSGRSAPPAPKGQSQKRKGSRLPAGFSGTVTS